MNERLTNALTLADTAGVKRVRYKAAAEAATAEAEALTAQAEVKRGESAFLLAEAEKQDQAYVAAIDRIVEMGVDRADAESMVGLRVKMLGKSSVDIPLPTQERSGSRTRGGAKRRPRGDSDDGAGTQGAQRGEEGASSGDEAERVEGGASPEGVEGEGPSRTEPRPFRLPPAQSDVTPNEGE